MTSAIAPRVQQVVATDYADNMLAILRERMKGAGISNVEAVHRDIYALGYPSESFDVVVAGNVLHLVPDLERALDALCHVLRPGGKLITPTFAHDETALAWVASRVLANVLGQPMHRRFTTASLRHALEQRGFRITRAETILGLIPIAYVECPGTAINSWLADNRQAQRLQKRSLFGDFDRVPAACHFSNAPGRARAWEACHGNASQVL
jgi:ubiquinone/menaquinone biosynthesis C-methylase UbiE